VRVTISCFVLEGKDVKAARQLAESRKKGLSQQKGNLLLDYSVERSGGTILLLLIHKEGAGSGRVRGLARQVLSSESNLGVAEMELEERDEESFAAFYSKVSVKDFNIGLYEVYVNPLNTMGLVSDSGMRAGFKFEVYGDGGGRAVLDSPEDSYDLFSLLDYGGYIVRRVYRKTGEIAASVGYAGSGRLLLARCGRGFPGLEDVLNPFSSGKSKPKVFSFSQKGGMLGEFKPGKEVWDGKAVLSNVLWRLKPRFRQDR